MFRLCLASLAFAALSACSKPPAQAGALPDQPPHGGTPVALGDGTYHLEFVLDRAAGKLDAYVLDGEMEEFVRTAMPSFAATAIAGGEKRALVFQAVASPATGETVGNTSLFSAQADWLKTFAEFDLVLAKVEVRSSTFTGVAFNFPKGNDPD